MIFQRVLNFIHLALGFVFVAYGRLLARILEGGGKPSSRITNFTRVVLVAMLMKAIVVTTTHLFCSETWRFTYVVYPHLIFTVPDVTPSIYLLWIWSGNSSRWLKDLHLKQRIQEQMVKLSRAFVDGTEEVRNSFRSTTNRFSDGQVMNIFPKRIVQLHSHLHLHYLSSTCTATFPLLRRQLYSRPQHLGC